MGKEYLDIVDENNKLTGKRELRLLVHDSGLWHRTVHIYLFKIENDIIYFLVHLRAKDKDLSPNKWDARFGGHVKSGESIKLAVTNEVNEEIGLDIRSNNLIAGEWIKSGKFPNREFVKVFYLEYTGSLEDLKFNDGEVQEVKWLSFDNILKEFEKINEMWAGSKKVFMDVYEVLTDKLNK